MKYKLSVVAALGAMLCLILAPGAAIESARYALTLCAELLIPSLLPFFAASALLIRLGLPRQLGRVLTPLSRRVWGVSGAGASAFFAGLLGGYPLGAQTIGELYTSGQISRTEAERLLLFCNNTGPSFLVGVIGSSLFSSRAIGLMLYAIHAAAAALTGFFFRGSAEAEQFPPELKEQPLSLALVGAVQQAVGSILNVSGFVICFCVLSGMLESLGFYAAAAAELRELTGLSFETLRALLIGLLELSSGIGALRTLAPDRTVFILCAFLSGWGGLSVQFQTLAVLAETDLDCRRHLLGRLLSGLISALLAAAISRFCLLPPVLIS